MKGFWDSNDKTPKEVDTSKTKKATYMKMDSGTRLRKMQQSLR